MKKKIDAWAVVTAKGTLLTPAAWKNTYSVFQAEGTAKLIALSWAASSGRAYRTVPVEIHYSLPSKPKKKITK